MKSTVKFAIVTFKETPETGYCFLTDMKSLKPGEAIVVETVRGLKIAAFQEYVETFPFEHARRARWIIQKVDTRKLIDFKQVNIFKVLEESSKNAQKRALSEQADKLAEQLLEIQRKLAEL